MILFKRKNECELMEKNSITKNLIIIIDLETILEFLPNVTDFTQPTLLFN